MDTLNSGSSEYLAAVAAFEEAAERLAQASPVLLSSQETLESMERIETAARKVPYAQNWIAQSAVEHGVVYELGYTCLKELLQQRLHLAGGEARERIHGARSRVPRNESTCTAEPRYPVLAAAQRAGRLSERHAAVIDRALHQAGQRVMGDDFTLLEELLVAAAETITPDDLVKVGKRAVEHIDPDAAEPTDETIARKRELTIGRQAEDLMTPLDGALTPTCRALLDTIMAKYARPGVLNPADAPAPVDPDDTDAVRDAASRDHRSAGQRQHDALEHALGIAISSGQLGTHRGVPCQPIITLTIDQLETETGIATTANGGRMPVADALNLMGTNPKYVLLLDLQHRPLFLGRTKRLATADQRIALYGADCGCTAPGCDAPATRCQVPGARCQVHHVTEWADGGTTDITGLTLVCDKHHGKVVPPADREHRPRLGNHHHQRQRIHRSHRLAPHPRPRLHGQRNRTRQPWHEG